MKLRANITADDDDRSRWTLEFDSVDLLPQDDAEFFRKLFARAHPNITFEIVA